MRFGFPFGSSAASFAQVGPADASASLATFKIIDVRGPDEFDGQLGHVPGARLVPLHILPMKVGELGLSEDDRILVVCRSGGRSAQAADLLGRKGFKNVHNLAGGMLSWRSHGLPVCAHRHGAGHDGVRCDVKKSA
jgi:sulfur dioxygenase